MIPASSTREPFCIRCNATEKALNAGGFDFVIENARHRIGVCNRCTTFDDRAYGGKHETYDELKAAIATYIKDARNTFAHEIAKP